MSFDDLKSDFALLDDWEDRYRYIIELGRGLSPMAAELKTEASKVRGCASQVWLVCSRAPGPDGKDRLSFVGDSDAHIVRGLIAVLFALYQGKTADEILAIEPMTVFAGLGLQEHLTPQRSNGLSSMVERIRSFALAPA